MYVNAGTVYGLRTSVIVYSWSTRTDGKRVFGFAQLLMIVIVNGKGEVSTFA